MQNESEHEMPPVGERLIRPKEVRKKLGGPSDMWLHRHQRELPIPIKISGRRFWIEREIDQYIAARAAARGR